MNKPVNKSRRNILLGGLTLGALGAGLLAKPKDVGQNHSSYFNKLSTALDKAKFSTPTLVIDKSLLTNNINSLTNFIGNRFNYRIVAKSLPSIRLLQAVMHTGNTKRLMLFHQPFINQVANALPQSDVLMGKPMPVAAAAKFYAEHSSARQMNINNPAFDAEHQLQWLIDSPVRMLQYQKLAKQLGVSMRINIELDVGLHRGGVQDNQDLVDILTIIKSDPMLSFSGFMGYEAHIAKVPLDKTDLLNKAMAVYTERLNVAQKTLNRPLDDLTLNCGGSPTYRLYNQGSFPHNELAAGSCLVKPTDFDLPQLADHQPACFIATPVIKSLKNTKLPGLNGLAQVMSAWNPNLEQAFFTYGGYWKAKPESPQGLTSNPVFGHSSNQEMLNGSRQINLKPDDWIFLRPTQSESVFLQFGDIAIYDQGEIIELWPVLQQG